MRRFLLSLALLLSALAHGREPQFPASPEELLAPTLQSEVERRALERRHDPGPENRDLFGRAFRQVPRELPTGTPLSSSQINLLLDAIFFRATRQLPAEPARVPQLVNQLSDGAFAVRHRASEELVGMRNAIDPELKKALAAHRDDPELRARLRTILAQIKYLSRKEEHNPFSMEPAFRAHLKRVPDKHLAFLVRGVIARADRGSDHKNHPALVGLVISRVRDSGQVGLLQILAPLLEGADRALAVAVVAAVAPQRNRNAPIHPLYLAALTHARDDLVFLAMQCAFHTPNGDPNFKRVKAGLHAALKRNPPAEAGIRAAGTLLRVFDDPSGLAFMRSLPGGNPLEEIPALKTARLAPEARDAVELVARLTRAQGRVDDEIPPMVVHSLFSRANAGQIRAGIAILEQLAAPEVERMAEASGHSFAQDLLLNELSKAVAEDDGIGPGGKAGIYLRALRGQPANQPSLPGIRRFPAFP